MSVGGAKPKYASSRTATLTVAALTCFAANSLLCRAALRPGLIDAATFTTLRLLSGAVALAAIVRASRRPVAADTGGTWASGAALFGYAIAFSLAYVRLDAGTGALILFGSVQATMIGYGMRRGERPRAVEWLGLALALAGLVVLTRPGRTAPDPVASVLMAAAGMAWGVYSLRGRGSANPIAANAGNFARSVPMAGVASLVAVVGVGAHVAPAGLLLAAASGALASGVGYALWYAALRGLTATRAAIVQLAVPPLAALGSSVFLGETLGLRLVVASVAVLGGIALAIRSRRAG